MGIVTACTECSVWERLSIGFFFRMVPEKECEMGDKRFLQPNALFVAPAPFFS